MKARWFWSAALGVLAADHLTKYLAVYYLTPAFVPHRVVGEAVRFTLVYNPGAAFGLPLTPPLRVVLLAFSFLALALLASLYRSTHPADRLQALAIGLVAGGAVGNLIDRLRSARGVVDFIDVGLGGHRFWTFNVADAGITVGAALLVWSLLRAAPPSGSTR